MTVCPRQATVAEGVTSTSIEGPAKVVASTVQAGVVTLTKYLPSSVRVTSFWRLTTSPTWLVHTKLNLAKLGLRAGSSLTAVIVTASLPQSTTSGGMLNTGPVWTITFIVCW